MTDTTYRKKLIEVALPLKAINEASAREKSIRHGHPSTLHLWWARRPLAACRAVLFSSLVNDPDDDPMYGVSEDIAATERAKLFDLIEDLVLWANSNNPKVINRARLEIARSIAANKVADGELDDDAALVANAPELPEETAKYMPDPPAEYTPHDVRFKMPGLKPEQVNHFLAHYAPPVLDPFAGGGSIPLEAQRLGLRAYASDLNPVSVLINKALIEIPPKFANMPPINPEARKGKLKNAEWHGAQGLAEDVRYYGKWMRDEAEKRIGHLYPKVEVTEEMAADRPDLEPYVGQTLEIIAWVWARTVSSPNPAAKGAKVPLARSFWLSKKKGKECFIYPQVDPSRSTYSFTIGTGKPKDFDPAKGTVERTGATCLLTDAPIPFEFIRKEGKSGRLGAKLMAIVAKGNRSRVYLPATDEHEALAFSAEPTNYPETEVPDLALGFRVQLYGMNQHHKLFTRRQLVALTTLSDLVTNVYAELKRNESASPDYAIAVATMLGLAVSRQSNYCSTICVWSSHTKDELVKQVFMRQAIPMTWDFGEANIFSSAGGTWDSQLSWLAHAIPEMPAPLVGHVTQADASQAATQLSDVVVSCDPPYYDSIGYADLSDYFYIWLRRSLGDLLPELFTTVLTPKSSELIATPHRHNEDKVAAGEFFEAGLRETLTHLRSKSNKDVPLTVFYAFKQSETSADNNGEDHRNTGWETMLEGVMQSGCRVTGTWPIRTELIGNLKKNVAALASSIVLVCRRRDEDADIVTRRDFANDLRKELPEAIRHLQSGNVAPVDLAQASIGPGMAVFSRYKQVVNADGSPMSVREALQLINQVLDEALAEQESDFDSETRFALRWFEQYGTKEGPFGDAETLAKAMAVAVSGVVEAGIVHSGAGKVRLVARDELDADWNPADDARLTMWESTQHLIHTLEQDGETGAADLLSRLIAHKGSAYAECVRELSYRLYQTCDRAKRAEEARSYNGLVVSWPEIAKLARELKSSGPKATQHTMFE